MYSTTTEFFMPKSKRSPTIPSIITPLAKATYTNFDDTLTVETFPESVDNPSTNLDTNASDTEDDTEPEQKLSDGSQDDDFDDTDNTDNGDEDDATMTDAAEAIKIKLARQAPTPLAASSLAAPINAPPSSPHTHPFTAPIANTNTPLMKTADNATMTDAPEEDEATEIANQLQQQDAAAFKLARQARVNAANALLAKSFIYSYHEDKFPPTKLGKKFKNQSRLWNASPTPTHLDPLPKRTKGQDFKSIHDVIVS